MAANSNVLDNFAQWAAIRLVATWGAAGGSTAYQKLETGITNLQKTAWEVSKIEYDIPAAIRAIINEVNDILYVIVGQAVTQAASPYLDNASIIDMYKKAEIFAPAAAAPGMAGQELLVVHEFSQPVLVLPQNLYLSSYIYNTTGAGSADIVARIWYKERELTKEDWYDLLQLRLPLGAS